MQGYLTSLFFNSVLIFGLSLYYWSRCTALSFSRSMISNVECIREGVYSIEWTLYPNALRPTAVGQLKLNPICKMGYLAHINTNFDRYFATWLWFSVWTGSINYYFAVQEFSK